MAKDIWASCKAGDMDRLKHLLDVEHVDMHSRDEYDYTPLHWAAQRGQAEIVEFLTRRGASVNVLDRWFRTPLHRAAKEGHHEIVALLIAAGAEVNAKGDNEWTPLHCSSFHGNMEVVRMLLQNGADRGARDLQGRTPVNVAKQGMFDVDEATKEAITTLLDEGFLDQQLTELLDQGLSGGEFGDGLGGVLEGQEGVDLSGMRSELEIHCPDPDNPENDLYSEVRFLRGEVDGLKKELSGSSDLASLLDEINSPLLAGLTLPPASGAAAGGAGGTKRGRDEEDDIDLDTLLLGDAAAAGAAGGEGGSGGGAAEGIVSSLEGQPQLKRIMAQKDEEITTLRKRMAVMEKVMVGLVKGASPASMKKQISRSAFSSPAPRLQDGRQGQGHQRAPSRGDSSSPRGASAPPPRGFHGDLLRGMSSEYINSGINDMPPPPPHPGAEAGLQSVQGLQPPPESVVGQQSQMEQGGQLLDEADTAEDSLVDFLCSQLEDAATS